MVGIVIVSHSATLASGVVELARQMGGGEVPIEPAGGMADGEIGTDMELVQAAIGRAAGSDGVLVLMDLGSAVMSAEMAAEMVAAENGPRVLLCEAPLVEGAVAAAARAGAGAPLDEVAAEARSALGMKAAQLGVDAAPEPTASTVPTGATELRLTVPNRLGLHARPAARFVETASRFDAEITVRDETTGRGPADARSLTALVTLGVRQGHSILLQAGGPQADEALTALRELAETGFGDEDGAAPTTPTASSAATTTSSSSAAPTASSTRPGPGSLPAAPTASSAPPTPDSSPPPAGARLQGVPAASGIVIAPARHTTPAVAADHDGPVGDPDAELARLDEARAAARADIVAAREKITTEAGPAEAAIFDAHLLLLDDAAVLDPARKAIAEGAGAVAAWRAAAGEAAAAYRALDDPYLKERAADVDDVAGRVLRHLTGQTGPGGIEVAGVLVVRDLTPGDAAALDRDLVQGLAVARGGATSHAAILARALGIPSVVGLGETVLSIAEGTTLVVDGDAGTIEVDPPPDVIADRERAQAAAEERRRRARDRAREPARTRDGITIEVAANVGAADEAAAAVELGADGIGLLRTEFLFLDRDEAPSEDEQREVYERVAAAMDGRPVIVRTLDAGADKPLRFLPQAPEDNPFLGVRGIRLGLAQPDLLRTQLRAIAAVAARHPIKVMFPMVATVAEYRTARAMLEETGAPPIEVGVMVEVPALALAADRFAREVDFFSVGTNDLTQYTMAAERGNEALAPLLAGPLPPVLGLIAAVTAAAERHGRWVGVCGELAGDPAAALLLAGLGVRELSMAAGRIPEVKEALRAVTIEGARAAAREALEADDAAAATAAAAPLLGGD